MGSIIGYEDMEFGARAQKKGVECCYTKKASGFHLWHPKEDSGKIFIENQINPHYFIIKYNISDLHFLQDVDWRYWRHYKKVRGARLILDDKILWAINKAG